MTDWPADNPVFIYVCVCVCVCVWKNHVGHMIGLSFVKASGQLESDTTIFKYFGPRVPR